VAAPALLDRAAATQEARARTLSAQLREWFESLRRDLLRRLSAEGPTRLVTGLSRAPVAKARAPTADEMARLLRDWGVAQAAQAAEQARKQAVGALRLDAVAARGPVPLAEFRSLADGASGRAAEILRETQRRVTAEIQTTLAGALREDPVPSTADIARRLRERIESLPALSFERATTIARTEQGIAQNAGIVAGYESAGVRRIRWLAYQTPRWDRRHHEMHNRERDLDGPPFELPDGTEMRWPGDLLGPAKHVINCRCSTAPVRTPRAMAPATPTVAAPTVARATTAAPPPPVVVPTVPQDAPAWMQAVQPSVTESDLVDAYEYQGHMATIIDARGLGARPEDLAPEERQVLDAITLWTNGNVASVRNPDEYEPKLAKKPINGIAMGQVITQASTQKGDYQRAHEVMRKLAAAPLSRARPIYRGIKLDAKALASLQPGQVFALGAVTSFSDDRDQAENFAVSEDGALLMIEKPTRGTNVRPLSVYDFESEIVVGGYVRIVRIDRDPGQLPVIYLATE